MRTRKPCPACHEVHPGRAADEVCYECKKLLEDGRKARQASARNIQYEDRVFVHVPRHRHWFPSFYHGTADRDDTLRDLMADLIRLVTREEVIEHRPASAEYLTGPEFSIHQIDRSQHFLPRYAGWEDDSSAPARTASREAVALIRGLYTAIGESRERAYKTGRAHGQNLLLQLASGDLTVKEFNERSMHANDA